MDFSNQQQSSNRELTNSFDKSRAYEPTRRKMLGWLIAGGATTFLNGCGGDVNVSAGPIAPIPASTWADDFQVLASNIRTTHPDPNGIVKSAAWQERLTQIIAASGQRSDKANLVEALKFSAMMRDEHTRITFPAGAFAQTAVRFASASDGFFVQQTTESAASLLGARLLAIDGIAIAEVAERLKIVIPAATSAAFTSQTPALLNLTELLWILGIGLNLTQSTYLLRDRNGTERIANFLAGDNTPLANIYGRSGGPSLPLWLTQPERNYFMGMLSGSQSVYVRYARCAIDALTPIDTFFGNVAQSLSLLPAPRLIFDLRNNPGGDSSLLANAIQQRLSSGGQAGQIAIAVLINNSSFSSAVNNLYDLRRLGALSFGEAPGTAPNHTGELRSFTLPRTSTQHSVSARTFTLDPTLGANNYSPDFVVANNIEERISGRDPVLERAEQYMRTGK